MEDKLKAIIKAAEKNGWEYPEETYSWLGNDWSYSELIREPGHGFLKSIYGTAIIKKEDHMDWQVSGSPACFVGQSYKYYQMKFATIPLEDVIDDIYEYVNNNKSSREILEDNTESDKFMKKMTDYLESEYDETKDA